MALTHEKCQLLFFAWKVSCTVSSDHIALYHDFTILSDGVVPPWVEAGMGAGVECPKKVRHLIQMLRDTSLRFTSCQRRAICSVLSLRKKGNTG